MIRLFSLILVSAALLFGVSASVDAASLRVAPTTLDITASTSAATTIRIWNDAKTPINVQVRVFRWVQRGGRDIYEQTKDVVASPPMTTLQPGAENLIRVVRTSQRPVGDEESYRLLVDELPNPARRQAGSVALVVRHSIPVFIRNPNVMAAAPSWRVEPRRGGVIVTAQNQGQKRLRISNLTVASEGKILARRDGLVGYVLGNSSTSWFIPGTGQTRLSAGSARITADSESGRFDATAVLRGG